MGLLDRHVQSQLEDIRDLLHGDHRNLVLPIVGSGLSSPHLPGWTALLELLIDQATDEQRNALKSHLQSGRFLDVAAALEVDPRVQATGIATAIRRHYMRPKITRPPVYDLVAQLPVEHFATTNFDPWLKDAVSSRLRSVPRIITPADRDGWNELGPSSPPVVLMLHGDADRLPTCALSSLAFRRLIHGNAAFQQGFNSLIGARSLLFIGHSLRDADLVLMLDSWAEKMGGEGRGSHAPRHFILINELDPVERTRLLNHGVQPIEYAPPGDYAALPEILQFLGTPPPIRPVERPSAVDSVVHSEPNRVQPVDRGAPASLEKWREVNRVVDAHRHLLSGNASAAEETFARAVDDYGETPSLLNVKSLLLSRLGMHREASEISREILDRFGEELGPADEAMHHWLLGDLQTAEAKAIDALIVDPTNVLAWLVRAGSLMNDDLDKALRNVDVALDIFLRIYQAWGLRLRARILLNRGEPEQALQAITSSLELHPHSAFAYDTRSSILLKLNRQSDALADLDRAIHISPKWPDPRRMKAAILADLHHHAEAIAAATDALTMGGDDALMLEIRAENLLALKRYRDAKADVAKARALDPASKSLEALAVKLVKK